MIRKSTFLSLLFLSYISGFAQNAVDYINPIIGATTDQAQGEGKTFPGAATPLGLVQLSPDTITGGDNGSGYSYTHSSIQGFSFTHMSGVGWYGDLGNFEVMPTCGDLKTSSGSPTLSIDGYRSHFSHASEVTQAGYYAVTLSDYNIRTELTTAAHAGILRFTFPENKNSRIQIDLARRIGGTSTYQSVTVVNDHTIEGYMLCPPSGGGWGNGSGNANYTVYFYAEFSQPLVDYGVWSADIPESWKRTNNEVPTNWYQEKISHASIIPHIAHYEGKHIGFFTNFKTHANQIVCVKSGISFVSIAGAKANLETDIPDWNFNRIREKAREAWSQALAPIQIEGGSEIEKQIFYTCMYHALLDPRSVSDCDGSYLASDNKTYKSTQFTYRTVFSGWDVYRAEMPLLTLIRPDIVNDEINSLLQITRLSKDHTLPRWEFMGVESGCMIGDPAISVISEAWLKGIRNFNITEAYLMCLASANSPTSKRKDEDFYEEHGWVPDSMSWTLENAYFDYCLSRLAKHLNKKDDEIKFFNRSKNYKNIYDPAVGNMHSRLVTGEWMKWKGLTAFNQGSVESNPYQQGWFVPQDIPGLIELMGKDYFITHLNNLFENTPQDMRWNKYYNHSNEPVHHIAYLYDYAHMPWLSQKWVRYILNHAYGTGVSGLCGNDDVGQMSAWYIFSALGFYPVSPVDGIYMIGSPLFNKAIIHIPNSDKTFTIIANNQSPTNLYIQSALLNGHSLNRCYLTHKEITQGGILMFEMGPVPNKNWGLNN